VSRYAKAITVEKATGVGVIEAWLIGGSSGKAVICGDEHGTKLLYRLLYNQKMSSNVHRHFRRWWLYNVNVHQLLGQNQVNPYTAQTLNPICRVVVQKN
jgi:hypothetical protein